MTRALHGALHELIDTAPGAHDADEEARILNELSQQFQATAEQIATEHSATPEDMEDLRMARELLSKELGRLSLSELVAEMDVAVATDDQQKLDIALDDLHKRFPQDTPNPGLARANLRSIMDYEKAIELAKTKGGDARVSNQMGFAAAINDKELGTNFDDTIAVSNWTMQEQRGELEDENRPVLEELRRREEERLHVLRRREEERRKLEDKEVEDDDSYDDAQKVDMSQFLDDDEDDEIAA